MDADYQSDAAFESGGAGLLSTLGDYSRFAELLARGGELKGVRVMIDPKEELSAVYSFK